MTDHLERHAVRIDDVRAEVARMKRSQRRRTAVGPAGGKSALVERVHETAVLDRERHERSDARTLATRISGSTATSRRRGRSTSSGKGARPCC
jgi:hypothetical protein